MPEIKFASDLISGTLEFFCAKDIQVGKFREKRGKTVVKEVVDNSGNAAAREEVLSLGCNF